MSAPVSQPRMVHCPASPLRPILDSLSRIARSHAPALVTGESGTGKEGVARLIHQLSPWSHGPFVALNCGAIPSNLLESELFGHVRGAFTGADRNRIGRFEAASGGTLFLDEIGETPPDFQVKLLRVLQERSFVPVGSSTQRPADARVVAATNIDLREAVASGRLREDLFFRLDVIRVELPPLRERILDIPPLVRHFIAVHAAECMSRIEDVTPEALDELRKHHWPGNVRELENVIQGILVRKESGVIDADDVRQRLGRVRVTEGRGAGGRVATGSLATQGVVVGREVRALPSPPRYESQEPRGGEAWPLALLPEEGVSLKETLERVERDYIHQALVRAQGNRARAASLLGINRTTLVEKLRRMPEWADAAELSALSRLGVDSDRHAH